MTNAKNIKTARQSSGLSRAQLAEMVGVKPRTVEHWEQGRRNPSKAAIILLNSALELNKPIN